MSDFEVNERAFFIKHGKSFKKFIKEIEDSKNTGDSNLDILNRVMDDIVGNIRKKIDSNDNWNKLK